MLLLRPPSALALIFVLELTGLHGAAPLANQSSDSLSALKASWQHPERTYRPRMRWWWPGNVLTKADITHQLEEMKGQGIGGVELMSTWKMYETGNAEYLSPEYRAEVQWAVAEAKRLEMDLAITAGSGWAFGGSWVPPEDQSKVMTMTMVEVEGGGHFSAPAPNSPLPKDPRNVEAPGHGEEPGQLLAVVAARETTGGGLEADSLVDLTAQPAAGRGSLDWTAPAGKWRLMAFWLKRTWQINHAQSFEGPPMVIDHLNQGAVTRYLDHLGGWYFAAAGADFGSTIDSFFCDSFEISAPERTLLWSSDTLDEFRREMGYDLTKYLPALWYDIGPETPRLRYDLGKFLSDLSLKTFFEPFNAWCADHHTQARVQPHYRFPDELIQASGLVQRPETELTTARFEPVVEPRKATASGARFYGRDIVSAEAYTFVHMTRYRSTLQELKIATDAFLRDGVTQFYNAGYFGSPERTVAPNRDLPWDSNDLNHWSPWWKDYHGLGDYVARSCALLRPGRLAADVMIYSPQDTAWSERALWGEQIRALPYGDLAKTLVANGYDFDVVNDNLLQHHAGFQSGGAEINGNIRRVLLLPRTTVMPVETMRAIKAFAAAGGLVVALEKLPTAAAGLQQAAAHDAELQSLVQELFAAGTSGQPRGLFLPEYAIITPKYYPGPKPYAATEPLRPAQRALLAAIGRIAPPDFALPGRAQSDGLTFIHKQSSSADVYFVTNLEPAEADVDATFRCTGQTVERWDPMTGEIVSLDVRSGSADTTLPLRLHAWESTVIVFSHEPMTGRTPPPRPPRWEVAEERPLPGLWRMTLAGDRFPALTLETPTLTSWTDRERTRHFSGTGRYEISFDWQGKPSADHTQVILDLGRVGEVAEVTLNGRPAGVAWMAPYRIDLSRCLQPGSNRLVVQVANTLINYVTGLKNSPEVPPELQARLGKFSPAVYPGGKLGAFPDSWLTTELGEKDLPPSGLLGPVRLITLHAP